MKKIWFLLGVMFLAGCSKTVAVRDNMLAEKPGGIVTYCSSCFSKQSNRESAYKRMASICGAKVYKIVTESTQFDEGQMMEILSFDCN